MSIQITKLKSWKPSGNVKIAKTRLKITIWYISPSNWASCWKFCYPSKSTTTKTAAASWPTKLLTGRLLSLKILIHWGLTQIVALPKIRWHVARARARSTGRSTSNSFDPKNHLLSKWIDQEIWNAQTPVVKLKMGTFW